MSKRNFITRFKGLKIYQKITLVASFAVVLGVLLPWYKDLDSRQIGDVFLGVTGPLSLIGIIMLLMTATVLTLDLMHMYNRKAPKLPMSEGFLKMLIGVEALFLLLITNSVYFHPKFGINITQKEVGIGMVLAFLGMVGITMGGYFFNKFEERGEVGETFELEKEPEPLAKMPQERPRVVDPPLSSQQSVVDPGEIIERKIPAGQPESEETQTIRMDL